MSAEDPFVLSLTVEAPILSGAEQARPGDTVLFARSGRAFIVHELPPNYGRWLGYFTDGLVSPRSHSPDETLSELVRLASAPPQPPAPAKRRWWARSA
jgi:hypothetical protein